MLIPKEPDLLKIKELCQICGKEIISTKSNKKRYKDQGNLCFKCCSKAEATVKLKKKLSRTNSEGVEIKSIQGNL